MNGTTQCSGDDSSPCNVSNRTRGDKTEPPPEMSFRANEVSRGIFPSGKLYLVVVYYPTEWIPPLRLRCGRNDIRFLHWALRIQMYHDAGPQGPDGDGSSPLHDVVPFNQTGYNRNAAGGRLPMKLRCDCHRQSFYFDSLRGAPPLHAHHLSAHCFHFPRGKLLCRGFGWPVYRDGVRY